MKMFAKLADQGAVFLLVLGLGITAAMVPGIQRIRISKGLDPASTPQFNQLLQGVREVQNTFGQNSRQIVISVHADEVLKITDYRILEAIQGMTLALQSTPVLKHETVLSLATLKSVVSENDSIESRPIFKSLPRTAEESEALEKRIAGDPLFYGRLVSKDFKTTLLLATAFEHQELSDIHNQIEEAIAPFKKRVPGVAIQLLGEPELTYQLETSIGSEAFVFAGLSMLLIFFSFLLVFRSWKGVLIPFLSMLMVIIWTMGTMGYWGEPITILSTTIPIMLVVAGVEYVIHVYHHLLEGHAKGKTYRQVLESTIKKSFSPLAIATLANFIGSITLLSFAIRPIQHFGIFMAIGSLYTTIIVFLILPALYKILHRPVERIETALEHTIGHTIETTMHAVHAVPGADAAMMAPIGAVRDGIEGGWKGFWKGLRAKRLTDRFYAGVAALANQRPWTILIVTFFACGFAAFYSSKIRIGYDNISLLPEKSPFRIASKMLDQAFGGTQTFDIQVDTGLTGGVLDRATLAAVQDFEKKITEIPHVARTFSVVHILERLHVILNPSAKESLPETQAALSQYLFLVSMNETGISLGSLLTADQRKLKIQVTANAHDTMESERIHSAIEDAAERTLLRGMQIKMGGDPVGNIAVMRYLVWGKFQNILSSILTLFLMLAVMYRSITRSFYTIIPIFIQIALNFGLMGALGIRLDFITAIITSIAMGLGVDFGIHALEAIKDAHKRERDVPKAIERAISGHGRLIAYTALCNIIGFSVLLISGFHAIKTFALMMSFNMIALFFSALVVMPAIVRILPPEFITHHRKRNKLKEGRMSIALRFAVGMIFALVLSAGSFWLGNKADAAPPPPPRVEDLMKKSVQSVYASNEESVYAMRLRGMDGAESLRRMKIWFKSNGPESAKILIKFLEPADIRGTGLLSIVEKGKDPDQYVYLPALKKVRRIVGGNRNEPFLGSDFSMADLSAGKGDTRMEYRLDGEEKCDGTAPCWKIVGEAKKGADRESLSYSKIVLRMRKDNSIVMKSEFYNLAGQLEKIMTLEDVRKEGSRWVVNRMRMENALTKHSTVIESEKREASKIPPDSMFTPAFLERN